MMHNTIDNLLEALFIMRLTGIQFVLQIWYY